MTWAHHATVAAFLFALGAAVGSFVNVCVYRLPAGLNLLRPRSRCPRCLRPIAARDNVPIVGWLRLLGRCRHCREPISARYPLVEALVGLLPPALYAGAAICAPVDPLEGDPAGMLLALAGAFLAATALLTAGLIAYDRSRQPASAGPAAVVAGLGTSRGSAAELDVIAAPECPGRVPDARR